MHSTHLALAPKTQASLSPSQKKHQPKHPLKNRTAKKSARNEDVRELEAPLEESVDAFALLVPFAPPVGVASALSTPAIGLPVVIATHTWPLTDSDISTTGRPEIAVGRPPQNAQTHKCQIRQCAQGGEVTKPRRCSGAYW